MTGGESVPGGTAGGGPQLGSAWGVRRGRVGFPGPSLRMVKFNFSPLGVPPG